MRRRVAVAAVLMLVAIVLLPGVSFLSGRAGAAPQPAFTASKTVARAHVNADGSETQVDAKTVAVTVSQTDSLRPRQLIDVHWSGARPTQGYAANPNVPFARYQEYPVVLMQCIGDDAATPVSPTSCWTQTISERGSGFIPFGADHFPPWRVDRYADAADRKAVVGYYPAPLPEGCPGPNSQVARFVPFVSADHTTYYVNPDQYFNERCGKSLPPEMATDIPKDAPPPNTTYARTNLDGTGSAKFSVWGAEDNQSLGCSASVACSLVIIPIMGLSCNVTPKEELPPAAEAGAADAACRATGHQPPGQVNASLGGDSPNLFDISLAATADYWWSASNWRNRITVPLKFGTSAAVCDGRSDLAPLDLLGSELMSQATIQWAPAFCLDPTRFRFRHVRVGEPQAKAAVATSTADVALVSQPPPEGYPMPVVHAPIAVTGFAISYVADDKDGNPVTDLKLTARLLAKLLTTSYPAETGVVDALKKLPAGDPYAAMATNPEVIVQDPEFLALNPNFARNASSRSASALLALSGNSDVMYALTAYLNADPEARAWLNGTPDPWGMVVNPGYRNIALPAPTWPLLDTFTSADFSPYGKCAADPNDPNEVVKKLDPIPYGQLMASPVASLATIGLKVPFAISNANINCVVVTDESNGGLVVGARMVPWGRQTPGQRFMLGLTSLADAEFTETNTAALQSTATIANLSAKFTDASNRTFVQPTDDSMRAAMKLVRSDPATNTWPIVYNTLRSADGRDAYPGTMVVYADVPTKDLPAGDGAKVAQLLKFAVGDGQTAGFGNGQLPPGYLPLTAGNGLGELVNYTQRAADAVAAQQGDLPTIVPVASPSTSNSSGSGTSTTGNTGTATSTGTPGAGLGPSGGASASPSPSAPAQARPAGLTALLSSALAAWALPIILLVGVCSAFAGGVTRGVAYLVTWWRTP